MHQSFPIKCAISFNSNFNSYYLPRPMDIHLIRVGLNAKDLSDESRGSRVYKTKRTPPRLLKLSKSKDLKEPSWSSWGALFGFRCSRSGAQQRIGPAKRDKQSWERDKEGEREREKRNYLTNTAEEEEKKNPFAPMKPTINNISQVLEEDEDI